MMNRLSLIKIFLMSSLVVLVGCQTVPQKEVVVSNKVEVQTIKIPVLMKCVTIGEIPNIPATNMIPSKELAAEQMLSLLKADLDEFKEYAIVADSLLRGCLGGTPDIPKEVIKEIKEIK